jgi:hypothetical protein
MKNDAQKISRLDMKAGGNVSDSLKFVNFSQARQTNEFSNANPAPFLSRRFH